jgi:transcriptional regulator with XRE-family HTH domain
MDIERTTKEIILKELGEYIESKMKEREKHLLDTGAIERAMSISQFAQLLGVSRVWIHDILSGKKVTSDKLLIKIANTLEIDEYELFRVARRLHPDVLDTHLQEFLGEYYIDGLNE